MRFVLCIIVLVLVATAALGEEVTRKAGDTSLNFGFNGLNISDYKYGIGGKRWLTDNLAATASLDVYQSKDTDKDNVTFSVTQPPSIKTEQNWYGVSLGLEKHLTAHHNLSPYVGGELTYSNQRYSTDNWTSGSYSSATNKHSGITAIFGVEYALIENMSLSADYGYGYSYDRRKTNSVFANSEERFKRFGGGAGRLMLQFYL